jgi:putative transposase
VKKLLAETMRDNGMLKDVTSKHGDARRQAGIVADLQIERRACLALGADRTSVRYRSNRPDDASARVRLRELASVRRRLG